MTSLPSLTALRCFDASARHASFTKAAAEVHLTQGAVSHQILALEAQLGVPLFLRQRGGLQLTVAGRAYWSEVSPALRQLERATQNIVQHQGGGGELKLSVASSFGTFWLMPRLSGFVAAHPDITLSLSTHVGPVDYSRFAGDAAIEFCEGAVPGLHAQRVLALQAKPFAAPALLKSLGIACRARGLGRAELLRLLCQAPLVRQASVPHGWAAWLQAAGLRDAMPPGQLNAGPQYDLLSMALNGAIAGLGVALLPDYAAAGALQARQLLAVSSCSWTAEKAYFLRYPEWKGQLATVRRFGEWLRAVP
ncbi:LysR family transcriptional regulator [Ideonella sp. BN130291]|uniref:LysR family transcriptional regulator n=1 Tax=Ideonella sp. BN130291 TaxID=3112940 RepID=UPI002E262C5C|nr:LysR family transcriptional regulator [Ideonella sp. BN130291]